MILGSGLLASAFSRHFQANGPICVFARGVSNSSETDASNFLREEHALRNALASFPRLVYFSSCALVNPAASDTPYLAHKRRMEHITLEASTQNIAFRLPQVVGRTPNPHTLTNFLNDHIRAGKHFTVWAKAERNLMDVDDIARIAAAMVRDGIADRLATLASPRSLPMPEIVAIFEKVLGKHALYSLEDRGDPLLLDTETCLYYAGKVGIDLHSGYPERVIRHYYGT